MSDDTEVTDSSTRRNRLSFSFSETVQTSARRPVQLWKHALHKIRSIDLDPWVDFHTYKLTTRSALRHRYSAIKKKWVVDEIQVKIEETPFDRGAMRECFRLKKLPQTGSHTGDWHYASNYVAKRYISHVDKGVYFDDVRLQMEAKLWGEAFNRQNPPKKVDIFQLSVLEMRDSDTPSDNTSSSAEGGSSFYHVERFMEGEYRKYNSNSGFVDEELRNTPQAFSHFTFERSGHRLLVVDIQGVGDLYTDPQIHTADGVGYNDGNLGPRGMALFFHSHRCNPLCTYLGLTLFDLPPSELEQEDKEVEPSVSKPVTPDCPFDDSRTDEHGITHAVHDRQKAFDAEACVSKTSGRRRRSLSFTHHCNSSLRFGPTVARSTENMSSSTYLHRRRSDSLSVQSDNNSSNLVALPLYDTSRYDCWDDEVMSLNASCSPKPTDAHVLPLTDAHSLHAAFDGLSLSNQIPPLHGTEHYPKSLFSFDRSKLPRNRVASGDSGYSGRVQFITPPSSADFESHGSQSGHIFFPHCLGSDITSAATILSRSFVSLDDVSTHSPPAFVFDNIHSVYSIHGEDLGIPFSTLGKHNVTGLNYSNSLMNGRAGGFSIPRRHRNLSESSDVDAEETHRLAGNLLHQLMHESHKPSCADHPTNLDQEIGQSILGQIHHELARLHEAGRFLPGYKGGWSPAGLGGLVMANGAEAADKPPIPLNSPELCINWEAVLFHERHAAQLGCLEAMIVMAHYYLGLPTQLMLDCPIKPDQSDLRSGVDYLWRAAEGGDRRCIILLARYLDLSATLSEAQSSPDKKIPLDDFVLLPALQSASADAFPSIAPDSWAEAITWYQKAVNTASATAPSDGTPDEGLDAEGRYDAAEDLLPVYRILARMAEMYTIGGFGLKKDYNTAGDLFNQAGELASSARQGRFAAKYFELAEEAYGKTE